MVINSDPSIAFLLDSNSLSENQMVIAHVYAHVDFFKNNMWFGKTNRNILEMEYAVRGPIPQRAGEMRAAGRRTIACNIGNPQALGQQPITFYREVISLLEGGYNPAELGRCVTAHLTALTEAAGGSREHE